jgi:hypothetical protein
VSAHPGEKVEEEVVLSKEYDLSKPGKYMVQLLRERNRESQAVKSNIVQFTIVP